MLGEEALSFFVRFLIFRFRFRSVGGSIAVLMDRLRCAKEEVEGGDGRRETGEWMRGRSGGWNVDDDWGSTI